MTIIRRGLAGAFVAALAINRLLKEGRLGTAARRR